MYLTESRLSTNEMWCVADNYNYYMCYICAKGVLDSKFSYAVIDKISNFHDSCPKFYIFTKIVVFKKYNWDFFYIYQMLLPYKCCDWDM